MASKNKIYKIGLAIFNNGCLLLARKRGTQIYILPGGKPEGQENEFQTLEREIKEELNCRIDKEHLSLLGTFSDRLADEPESEVEVRLYVGQLHGRPRANAEIEELRWFDPSKEKTIKLAPSLSNQIIPFLISHGYLSKQSKKSGLHIFKLKQRVTKCA